METMYCYSIHAYFFIYLFIHKLLVLLVTYFYMICMNVLFKCTKLPGPGPGPGPGLCFYLLCYVMKLCFINHKCAHIFIANYSFICLFTSYLYYKLLVSI